MNVMSFNENQKSAGSFLQPYSPKMNLYLGEREMRVTEVFAVEMTFSEVGDPLS